MGKSDFIKRIEDELILAAKAHVISSYTAEILEDLCKIWDNHSLDIMISTESPDKIIKLFTDLCAGKTLLPVDFEQDEVENVHDNFIRYKRCKNLVKNTVTNTIYYANAYRIVCKKFYNAVFQYYKDYNGIYGSDKIYLSKGGVVTNEYIEKVYVKGDTFMPKDPINLDCNCVKIGMNGRIIYTIDSRSNKLKALMEFYEVPILKDDKFKNIDLRNFKFKEDENNDISA